MVPVKRLNGEEIWVNPHLIESIEATPDTIIVLNNGKRLVVQDPPDVLVAKIIEYRGIIHGGKLPKYDGIA